MAVTPTVLAAVVTASGVLALLLTERARVRRPGLVVVWTAGLAVVTAAGFWLVGRATGNSALALGVAAPGAAIWCAVLATGGRPGLLVDPPSEPAPTSEHASTRTGRSRTRRRQARYTRRYLLLVGGLVLALVALAVGDASGVLPWATWP